MRGCVAAKIGWEGNVPIATQAMSLDQQWEQNSPEDYQPRSVLDAARFLTEFLREVLQANENIHPLSQQ